MAQIKAEIDLTALSITGVQTVNITTTDIYGVSYTICTLTNDFTGVSVNDFINQLVLCVNAGASGFLAFNDNPVITFTRDGDISIFIGTQVNISYNDGVRDVFLGSASWIEVIAERTGCDGCYPYDLISCYGSYVIDLGLTADTVYNILFTDLHSNKYVYSVTTDSDGKFTIVPTGFPEGFFTPEFSPIVANITDANNAAVTFTIGYSLYDCLQLNAEYVTTIT